MYIKESSYTIFRTHQGGRKMQVFIPLFSFSDILYIFTWCQMSQFLVR
jgi:hypothetical protein